MRKLNFKHMVATASICAALLLSVTAEGASSINKAVRLTVGKADTVNLSKPVADLLVAMPGVADVGTLRADRLYIVGKALGDTNVLAFDEEGNQLANISVHVSIDQATLRDTLAEFFPDEDVEVRTVNEDIVLTGTVSNPSVANQVRDLAGRFVSAQGQTLVDLMRVRGEQQVMLKVKVIEAKRALLREYGFEADYKPGNAASTTNAFLNSVAGTGLTALSPFASGQIFLDDNSKFGPLKIALQALEEDGLINTLAEPNLTAISGETAGFLAGGEFPVPVGRDQDGNITLEFKQFGVSLNFTPTVLSEDRIALQLSTEVSSKSDADSVTLVNTIIPGLSVRRAETTVEMGSGGTIMIAGLIKSDTLDSISGLPGAKDIPILGELFKSKSFTRNESELIILVSPYIVEPYAEAEAARVDPPALPVDTLMPAPSYVPEVTPQQEKTGSEGPEKAIQKSLKKAEAKPVRAPSVVKRQEDALANVFVGNLRKAYGARVPAAVGESGFGYMID